MGEGECPGSGGIRTYVATDEAGNQAEATQTLTVLDTVPPALRCSPNPPPRSAEPLVLDSVMAEDVCSDVTLTWSLDSVPEASGTGACSSWTATDAWQHC